MSDTIKSGSASPRASIPIAASTDEAVTTSAPDCCILIASKTHAPASSSTTRMRSPLRSCSPTDRNRIKRIRISKLMRGGSEREARQHVDERSGGIVVRVRDVYKGAQVRRVEFRVDVLRNTRWEQFMNSAQ